MSKKTTGPRKINWSFMIIGARALELGQITHTYNVNINTYRLAMVKLFLYIWITQAIITGTIIRSFKKDNLISRASWSFFNIAD